MSGEDNTNPGVVTQQVLYDKLKDVHTDVRSNTKEIGKVNVKLARVETTLENLKPEVEENRRKANSLKQKVVRLKEDKAQRNGEEKGKNKVMRYVWPIVTAMIGGGITLVVSLIVGE